MWIYIHHHLQHLKEDAQRSKMYKLVTAPTKAQIIEFVPLSEVRYALAKDTDSTDSDTDDDKRLVGLIQTAYYNIEKNLGVRKILTKTWDYFTNSPQQKSPAHHRACSQNGIPSPVSCASFTA